MSLKPIQSPSEPIKPHEALTYHQVGSCTLSNEIWDSNTDFLNSPSFAIPYSGLVETVLDIQ